MASTTQAGSKRAADNDGPAQAAAQRATPDYSETITVIVGKDGAQKAFVVHKAPICAKSPYFKAACDGNRWSEGQEGVVKLADHDADTFEFFLHWVYTGELALRLVKGCGSSALARSWALADYVRASALCNRIANTCRVCITGCMSPSPPSYTHLRRGSTMWRLFIDQTASRLQQAKFKSLEGEFSHEVIFDVAARLLSGEPRGDIDPQKKDWCYYHDHPDGKPKCLEAGRTV